MIAVAPQCEEHVGEPFPPRCADCDQAAEEADAGES